MMALQAVESCRGHSIKHLQGLENSVSHLSLLGYYFGL